MSIFFSQFLFGPSSKPILKIISFDHCLISRYHNKEKENINNLDSSETKSFGKLSFLFKPFLQKIT